MTRCCVWLERMNARPVADGIMKLLVIRVMRSSHHRFISLLPKREFSDRLLPVLSEDHL